MGAINKRRAQQGIGAALILSAAVISVLVASTALHFLNSPFPGFWLYPDARIAITLQGPPEEMRPFDKIVKINGEEVKESEEIIERVGREKEGTIFHYQIQRYEQSISFSARPLDIYEISLPSKLLSPFELLRVNAFFFVGIGFIAVGAVAFFLNPGRKAGMLLAFCLSTGIMFLTTFDSFATHHPLAKFFHEVAFWMIPASLFALSLEFPRESKLVERLPWALWVPFALFALPPIFGLHFFGERTGWFRAHLVVFAAIDVAAIYFFVRLVRQLRRVEEPLVRQRAKILLVGSLAGFLPTTVVLVTSLAFQIAPPGGYFSAFMLLLVPLTFAYAILRHDLLDASTLVNQGLFYIAFLALAGVLYFLLILSFSVVATQSTVSKSPLFPLLFAGLVVFIAEPLRRRFWRFADRIYFRQGYDYRLTLKRASEEMVSVTDPEHVLIKLQAVAQESLEPTHARVLLFEHKTAPQNPALAKACVEADSAISALRLSEQGYDFEKDLQAQALEEMVGLSAQIVVPLIFQGRLLGLLVMGPKKSGLLYTSEDLSLLRILTNQSAVALENSRKFHLIEELNASLEAKVEERTRELKDTQAQLVESAKMASLGDLVAGVAHEINTPVGIGVTAASTLEEETQRLLVLSEEGKMKKSHLQSYLEMAKDSSRLLLSNLNRAASLIQSFKQVSVDQSSEERRRFDLKKYIEETLHSLYPKLKKTKHTVTLECKDAMYVDSYPGAFSQIITNLISNSIDHAYEAEDKGNLTINIKKDGYGIEICYRDDGKGISEENLGKIFDPFFTTRRGQGGSGLGLHIVYNLATQKLRGQIRCESKVGFGTSFIIFLPDSISSSGTLLVATSRA